jgi:Flp pilus assembly pilin Flp
MLPFVYRDQAEAQGLVEYALIMLLIAIFVLLSLTLLGSTVLDFMQGFAEQVSDLGGGD